MFVLYRPELCIWDMKTWKLSSIKRKTNELQPFLNTQMIKFSADILSHSVLNTIKFSAVVDETRTALFLCCNINTFLNHNGIFKV